MSVTFIRPAREKYLRRSIQIVVLEPELDCEVSVGVEYVADTYGSLSSEVRCLLEGARLRALGMRNPDVEQIAETVAAAIRDRWPERAYFVEVWSGDDRDGWVQVFQPYGLPRNQ